MALEGIARGRRGETNKFEQPERKHGEYRLAIDKARVAIDKKHEKKKKKVGMRALTLGTE